MALSGTFWQGAERRGRAGKGEAHMGTNWRGVETSGGAGLGVETRDGDGYEVDALGRLGMTV